MSAGYPIGYGVPVPFVDLYTNQTVNGVKTFQQTPVFSTGSIADGGSTFTLPVSTGTLALTSQIPSVPITTVAGDLAGFSDIHGTFEDAGIAISNVALLGTQFPASSVSSNVVSFSGTTGKVLQDSGIATSGLAHTSGALTNGNFASYNGSSQLVDSGIPTSDINQSVSTSATPSFATPLTVTSGSATAKLQAGTNGSGSVNFSDGTHNLTLVPVAGMTSSVTATFPDTTGTVALGPSSVTSGHIVSYNGTTGVIQDSTIPTSNVPLLSANNVWSGTQNFGANCTFNSTVNLPDDTSLTFININTPSKTMRVTLDGQSASTQLTLASSNTSAATVTFPAATGTMVTGPTSVTSGNLVSYNGTTGVIQDSGIASSSITGGPSLKFSRYHLANSTQINSATTTVLKYDTSDVTQSGLSYNSSTGTFTANNTCTLLCHASTTLLNDNGSYGATAPGSFEAYILVNSSGPYWASVIAANNTAANDIDVVTTVSHSTVIQLNSGDTFQVSAYNTTGAGLNGFMYFCGDNINTGISCKIQFWQYY